MKGARAFATRGIAIGLLICLAIVAISLPALAHALRLFAVVEGGTITGSVYFSGAGPARGAKIVVRAPDDTVLAETISGDDGSFVVQTGPVIDHRIFAEAADGHGATFTIRAAELSGVATPSETTRTAVALKPAPEAAGNGDPVSAHQLEAVVEAVVARHVTPLREQLNAYEERLRWHDVLGGIGYILGLTGLAALFTTWRRRKRSVRP